MAESTPCATCWGTIPGGGSPFLKSQISGTDAGNRQYKNRLGTKIVGLDANGFYGEWVWVLAGAAIGANKVCSVTDADTAALTAAQSFTVVLSAAGGGAAETQEVCGGAEAAVADAEYFWMRTRGIFTGTSASVAYVAWETKVVGMVASGTAGNVTIYAGATHTKVVPFAVSIKTATTTAPVLWLQCNVF